jgi:cytochrome c biogenesis protein CcdA
MFCPKCSQEQISDETRFCSRCGFQLNVVKALLSDTQAQGDETAKPERSLRKRDMTIGAFLMFVLAIIGAAITIDMPPSHSARIIIIVMAWMGLTLLLNIKPIIQYFLRADSSPANEVSSPGLMGKFTSKNKKSLPASHSIPASDLVMPGAKTAEIVQPPSVTEPTTNLLNKN